MSKFNDLFNKIILESSKLVQESVSVNDIRDMIKQMDKDSFEEKRNELINQITGLLLRGIDFAKDDEIKNLFKTANKDEEFLEFINKSLANNELVNVRIIPKLVDGLINYYNVDEDLKSSILKALTSAVENMHHYHGFDDPEVKKQFRLQQILSEIDAAHITDEDINVFTPETFNEYTRKVKAAFSYALFLKGDRLIGIAKFDETGKILHVEATEFLRYQLHAVHGTKNFKNMINNCDKIIAISNSHINNVKHREYYHEPSDDKIREQNQDRYKETLALRKVDRKKEDLKKRVNELFESIKDDLAPYQEKLMNIDMFEDSDIAKAYADLRLQINVLKKTLNDFVSKKSSTQTHFSDDWKVDNAIKKVKAIYLRLMELLEADDNVEG